MIIAGQTKKNQEKIKKAAKKVVKKSSYFEDGYDFGDVTKTLLSTAADAGTNISKGFIGTTEGVADTLTTLFGDLTQKSAKGQATIWELFGNDDYANSLREAGGQVKKSAYENAKTDVTSSIFNSTDALNATKYILGDESAVYNKDKNWSQELSNKSVAGDITQSVEQGVGNIAAFAGLGYLTGGSTAGTFATSFTSAYGNSYTNALRNGLDEKEARGSAISSGLAEAISEQVFQGIPGVSQAGWADNLIGDSVKKYFGSSTGKLALKMFDSFGEGLEEVISNMLESTFEGIRKGENIEQIWQDAKNQSFFNNEQTRDAFISALISSAITNGGSNLISNQQKQQVLETYAKENNITTEEAQKVFDKIVEKKANLEDTEHFKDRVELEENIEKGLVKEIKDSNKNNQKIDLNELFNQTPNSKQEVQFSLDQDEFKNVKSDKQKVLANDMARLNNVKENHDLFKVVNAIQSANNTQQYHITTTEGLYEMGIVNKDENGNYTMPDGSPYVPRGLNYKNGEIYINADVGSQSGTQAVYHEMFEGFKKAAPEQYNQFKQMVTDIIGEENIQKEFDTYKSMYGEELTDDIRDEIINDKFGELAENQNFINKIADNRNVLEKFIDSIKNMIKYVKGTNEERQLMKLQKNLEKEFAKRYKETDFSQSEGDTAYSLKESKAMLEKQFKEMTGDSLLVAEAKLGNYAFQQIRGNQVEAPYNQEAMDLLEKIQNSKKTSSHLYHSTPADRIQSIAKNGLVVGSKQNQEGVSSTNKLYLSATEELADSFTPENSVMLRISPNAKLENLDNDLLGGEGSYTITNNIEPKYLQVKENGKWIPLLKSKYANDTKYSLTKDSQGRELSPQQQEYFKDSKVVDKDGNLLTVYHTTTGFHEQFNEFNPVGTPNYKFGNQVVNFFTDSKKMSGSYADYDYQMANTKRINSMEEVDNVLGNRYTLKEKNGKYELYDRNDYTQLNGYKSIIKRYSQAEQDILNKTFGKSRSEVLDMLNNNEEQFNFYDKTRIKFLNDLYSWNLEQDIETNGTNKIIDDLIVDYLSSGNVQPKTIFNNKEDLFRNVENYVIPAEKYQYEGYINITNPYIMDAEGHLWNYIPNNEAVERAKQEFQRDFDAIDRAIDENTKQELYEIAQESKNISENAPSPKYDQAEYTKYVLENFGDNFDITQLYNNSNQSWTPLWEETYFKYNDLVKDALDKIDQEGYYFSPIDFYNIASERFNKEAYIDRQIQSGQYVQETNDIVKSVLDMNKNGSYYDGLIIKNVIDYGNVSDGDMTPHDVYVTFNSNQFKGVDNKTPTSDPDIRYSMTSNENIDSKEIAPIGSTVEETIAPIREDLSNITEQMNNLSNQIETLQNELETRPQGYVETYKEQRNENIPTKQLTEEDANTLQDALMNDEGYLRSLDEEANLNPENTKLIDKLTNDVSGRLDLSKNQKDTLRNIIKESIENGYSTNEISDALYREFSETSYDVTNDEAIEVKKLLRDTPIKVSDAIKKDISDYGRWKQSNFGKIRFSNMGSPVDTAYAELSDMMPYYFPSDIVNPTDQLLRIAEVANMATKSTETMNIEPEYFDDIADYIKNTQLEDEYNAKMKGQYDIDKDIQFNMIEDIAPTTIRTQESIDDFIENRDIAPVREDATNKKSKSPISERLDTMKRRFGEMITNRNYEIDKTSKATGNRDIKFAGDMLNNVSGEVQYNINNKQTDMNGNVIGKSVSEIFAPSKKAGLYEVFNDYLYNKSNIERHRVGKGSQVPEAVSEQLVKQYEQQYPELQEWANDVYNYYDNVLQEQVDAGLITQKQYDNYRGEHGIYRSYTPFYAESTDTSRYFDSEGKVKPVSTLKRSKGNADDVNQLLSMEDAMAKQTYAYKRAIRQNELYKEIVSSLEKYSDAMDMDVRDEPSNLNDSLYVTPEGNKVLSAYINGEKTSALISDELFNELSGENEARIKQLEKDFSLITTPLQKVSSARRNILTSWNPTFLARNAIKDIQDAVINSKHTGDMLKNYFGAKKGQKSAVFELREGKTKEAQQFLALYGADNLYGDYSNVGQKKGLINKFARANELIELAPRFAEFKASLQNGESVQEAIYNAREVTTNFGRGGYITKALNNNGFTFLNANVQGLDKLVRNLSGENGVKGVTSVVVKGAAFAVLPSILNELLYGFGDDKDEDYEALPNYIKDNYYLIKTVNGNFVRIPKGRINAAFGSIARRTINALEGDENPYEGALSNAWDQIGVGDLGGNNILAPINQAFGSKNGEAWYGGDIVPTRLQDKPASEQTDAKIDAISNFIGKNLGVSPYKVNYVLDQYSGGFGDVLLPMITPETKSGAEKPHEYLLAPIKDAFVVNSTDDNKYAGEFYNTKDKLETQYNSENATDEDILKYKYMSNISKQMSDLYKERREVQADTTIGNKEKYAKVQVIQNEINNLAKEALSNYNNFSNTGNYTNIDDVEYYKNSEGEWTKVKDEESEFTAGLNDAEKTAYYNVKNKISGITKDYTAKTKDLDKDDPKKAQYSTERKENITQAIVNSGLDNYTKAMVYSKYYSDKDAMTNAVNSGYDIDTYITALNDIGQLRDEYSKDNGYSTEERKQRTIAYINSLEMNIPQKAMMIRQYYSSFREYNNDIVDYVSNLNISYEDKKAILESTGMTVNGNNVSWK